jgi:peptidoglycan/xylan/chitin deacetylase (PgdA/CDA1 family)
VIRQTGIAGKVGLFDSDEWVLVTLSFSDAVTVGTPTRSGITGIRVLVDDVDPGPVKLFLGGVGKVANSASLYPTGVVSLTFDDVDGSQWTVAAPKLSEHSFRGTLYPIIGSVDQGSALTMTQLRALHDGMGWEVGAHATTSATHAASLTSMTDADAETELVTIRRWLLDRGFEADTYAWPNGKLNVTKRALVGSYYLAARGTYDVPNSVAQETFPAAQPTNFRSYNAAGRTLAQMKTLVDKCKVEKDWVVFTFHGIVASGATGNNVNQADFNSLVDYIAAADIPVLPVREVVRSFARSF